MCDYRRGFELAIGLTGHFHTRFLTTLNYSAIADFHTLKFIASHVKSFQSAFTIYFFPVTNLNFGDFSNASS
jgi:hypothetical protein